jgi:DNA-binding MarR family transcriptional regulator
MSRKAVGQLHLQDEVLYELKSLAGDLDLLDGRLAEQHGISRTDLRVLEFLSRGGPASAGQLAEVAGLTTGATTTAIDRLEHAGLARRGADPSDGRRVLVALTPAGMHRAAETLANLRKAAGGLLEAYTGEELLRLRDFVHGTRDAVAAHTASVRRQHLLRGRTPTITHA